MHSFPVSFSRTPVIVLILIVLPLVITALFLTPLIYIPVLPDWAVLAVCCVMMAAAIRCVLLAIKHWATVDAIATMDDQGIIVKLSRLTPFYRRAEYAGSWQDVENVSSNFEPRSDKYFYMVRFRNLGTAISLEPAAALAGTAETPFGELLQQYVARYNEAHSAQPETAIRQRGFYDAWWAKALTVLAWMASATVIVIYFIDRSVIDIWRVIQVLSFSAVWLGAYYANRRKKQG